MAAKKGIDSDQELGGERISKTQAIVKAPWMSTRMSMMLPKTLARDFKAECGTRGLTHIGILRDLALVWVIANKPGIVAEDYRKLIQEEVEGMKAAARAKDKAQSAKLTAHQKRDKFFADEKKKVPVPKQDAALHHDNPFEDGEWKLKG